MLYYDRVDVSKRINVIKISVSFECDVCHYLYFLKYSFKFLPNIFNRCHNISMMSMNLRGIDILTIKTSDDHCIFSLVIENEPIKLL